MCIGKYRSSQYSVAVALDTNAHQIRRSLGMNIRSHFDRSYRGREVRFVRQSIVRTGVGKRLRYYLGNQDGWYRLEVVAVPTVHFKVSRLCSRGATRLR